MDSIGPSGVSQAPVKRPPSLSGGAAVALSGDVDPHGEIVDVLRERALLEGLRADSIRYLDVYERSLLAELEREARP